MTSTSLGGEKRTALAFSVLTVTKILVAIAVLLVIISYSGQLAVRAFDWHPERDIVSFFNIDREPNLPTSYQSLVFLSCAVGLAAISVMKKLSRDRWTRHWALLSLIFAGLAWDEIAEIHERFIEPMRRAFDLQGIFFFGWIIPASIVVGLVGLTYFRFVLVLEPRIRTLFITSGIVFLAGALILEGLGGWYYERIDQNANMVYVTIATLEESLEMAGIIVFLHAALTHLAALLATGRISATASDGSLVVEAERHNQ